MCNVDVTVYHRGFHGDLNETFFVGNVSEKHKNLVKVTYEALQKAIEIVKPGERYREIGNVIQKHVQTHGYSVVKSYCGHGIHRLFHTAPNVPHYASEFNFRNIAPNSHFEFHFSKKCVERFSENNAVGVMKAGNVFTIEPMVSEGAFVCIHSIETQFKLKFD